MGGGASKSQKAPAEEKQGPPEPEPEPEPQEEPPPQEAAPDAQEPPAAGEPAAEPEPVRAREGDAGSVASDTSSDGPSGPEEGGGEAEPAGGEEDGDGDGDGEGVKKKKKKKKKKASVKKKRKRKEAGPGEAEAAKAEPEGSDMEKEAPEAGEGEAAPAEDAVDNPPADLAAAVAAAGTFEDLPAEAKAMILEQEREYNARLEAAAACTHFVPVDDALANKVKLAPLSDARPPWRVGQEVRVFCGTWNMEGAPPPPPDDLAALLNPGAHHIYAIASQECIRTINKSFLNSDKKAWEDALAEALGPRFKLVACHTMVATHLVVFARADIVRHICEATVETADVTTGLVKKTLGNKGGIGVGFVLGPADSRHSTSFLFLSAHFQAHQAQVEARNEDYAHITEKMKLGLKGKGVFRPPGAFSKGPVDAPAPARRDVTGEYDCVFFMGDFNYRVVGRRAPVEEMLKGDRHAFDACLRNDQLSQERRHGRTFPGFSEAQIAFPPTYKYAHNSDEYETKKMRIPSWTDRILFKQHPAVFDKRAPVGSELGVQCYNYTALQQLRHSDHRPVIGWYVLPTPLPEVSGVGAVVAVPQESSTCAVM